MAHVTGSALYVDDIALPGNALHVEVGVSEHASARLLSVDLTEVRTSEGVVDVITSTDIPGENEVGALLPGDRLLSSQQVEYVAQPIFAVAALSLRQAQLAVAKACLLYTSPSPRDQEASRMPSSA